MDNQAKPIGRPTLARELAALYFGDALIEEVDYTLTFANANAPYLVLPNDGARIAYQIECPLNQLFNFGDGKFVKALAKANANYLSNYVHRVQDIGDAVAAEVWGMCDTAATAIFVRTWRLT